MSLYIVSIPIGNPDDITLRAIKTFQDVDFLICEEYKNGRKLLKQLKLDKELYALNEHNELSDTEEILQLLLKGKHAALFSDCGTPLFADPGCYLVNRCHEVGVRVIPVPGASSLLTALVGAGVNLERFFYAGFLARNSDDRRKEISNLLSFTCPIVIFDAPYRLKPLLEDLKQELPAVRQLTLALSLTNPDELFLHGTIDDIIRQVGPHPAKKEFVLILKPLPVKKSKKHVKKRTRK
jgi:16S rRNA (cytidine1402-2'-O)-methyltransferase